MTEVLIPSRPLYARVMGDSWAQLAEPVRSAHDTRSSVHAHGCFRIEHGRHYVARAIASLVSLPRASVAAETRLMVKSRPDGEEWSRTFAGRPLTTRQYQASPCEIAERFGVLELRFDLEAADGNLVYHQRDAAFVCGPLRLRIPPRWAPRVDAREAPAGPHRLDVAVRVTLPAVGLLIAYEGSIDFEDRGP